MVIRLNVDNQRQPQNRLSTSKKFCEQLLCNIKIHLTISPQAK